MAGSKGGSRVGFGFGDRKVMVASDCGFGHWDYE